MSEKHFKALLKEPKLNYSGSLHAGIQTAFLWLQKMKNIIRETIHSTDSKTPTHRLNEDKDKKSGSLRTAVDDENQTAEQTIISS